MAQQIKTTTADSAADGAVIDVAVIGAGIAGLICAQQLKQAGYSVSVVEKSRGLGGRLATRRLHNTCADHGVRSLNVQGKLSQYLIQALLASAIIHPWTDGFLAASANAQENFSQPDPQYAACSGLTAVAKFLATGLEIRRGQRVQRLEASLKPTGLEPAGWRLMLEANGTDPMPLSARSIVMAIPAPQALMLLEPLLQTGLPADLIEQIRSVQFDPCFTAIAAYAPAHQAELEQFPWQAKTFADVPDLAWISLENTKRPAEMPVFVAQSTAEFAERYLEAKDLQLVGQQLLDAAAKLASWLNSPVELQAHRWRYAFVRQPLPEPCLTTALPLPLVCSGDWCGGSQAHRQASNIENAMQSGLAAARQIRYFLEPAAKIATPELTANQAQGLDQLMHQLAGS